MSHNKLSTKIIPDVKKRSIHFLIFKDKNPFKVKWTNLRAPPLGNGIWIYMLTKLILNENWPPGLKITREWGKERAEEPSFDSIRKGDPNLFPVNLNLTSQVD